MINNDCIYRWSLDNLVSYYRGEKIDTWNNQFSNFVGMCVNWARGPMKTEMSIEK